MAGLYNKNLGNAAVDLLYLLERGYTKKSALDLVGNRYRMSSDARMILYRGVFTQSACESRTGKMVHMEPSLPNDLVIDCYNVFITLESYLSGRPVFRAMDGFVRDISGVYGNYTFGESTVRVAELLIRCLIPYKAAITRLYCYLDSPVSRSGEFADYLRGEIESESIHATVEVVKSPDRKILHDHTESIIATSDTVLIDGVNTCLDLPALVLHEVMGRDVFSLWQLVGVRDLIWVKVLRDRIT
jgi:hypothetical protein